MEETVMRHEIICLLQPLLAPKRAAGGGATGVSAGLFGGGGVVNFFP